MKGGRGDDVLGTAPAEGEAGAAVPVVVQQASPTRPGDRFLDPNRRSGRSQADDVFQDVAEAHRRTGAVLRG